MKGLMIKDLKLVFKNNRLMIFIVMIAFFMLTMGEEGMSFIIGYLTILFTVMVISTISYDEFDKGMAFLMTLPISRKLYVREKYLFGMLAGLTGWIFALIINLGMSAVSTNISGAFFNLQFWMATAAILLISSLFLATMLPVQLKYGADNGKIVIAGIVGAIMVIAFLGERIIEKKISLDYINSLIEKITPGSLIAGAAVGALLLLGISYLISVRIMEKKEF